MSDDDSDLRALFRQQRGEDQSRVRDLDTLVARGRNRTRYPRIGLRPKWAVAALVLLTVGALVTLRQRERMADATAARNITAELTSRLWRAPTDFLLNIPASNLTRTVPTFVAPLQQDGTPRGITPRDTNAVRTRRSES